MADPTQAPSRQMPNQPEMIGYDQDGRPIFSQTGGISGAIANAIWMLARMGAPKSLTQFDPRTEQQVSAASGNAPLGQQF